MTRIDIDAEGLEQVTTELGDTWTPWLVTATGRGTDDHVYMYLQPCAPSFGDTVEGREQARELARRGLELQMRDAGVWEE